MATEIKLTKQGVRDLNHLRPAKAPVAVVAAASPLLADSADIAPAPLAVIEPALAPAADK
jgi:hypothetical protein